MSGQLVGPRQPVAAPPTHECGADRDRGMGLLLSFVGALSVMVADVVVIGAVDDSWILIPGVAVLLLMAAVVFGSIMRLLADGGETSEGART